MSFLPTDEEDAAVLAELDRERSRQREEDQLREHGALLKVFREEQALCAREMGNEREAQWWENRASSMGRIRTPSTHSETSAIGTAGNGSA